MKHLNIKNVFSCIFRVRILHTDCSTIYQPIKISKNLKTTHSPLCIVFLLNSYTKLFENRLRFLFLVLKYFSQIYSHDKLRFIKINTHLEHVQ